MVLTAGVLTLISAGSNSARLSSTAASGGTAPYTQQWHKSAEGSGFTPGPTNIITGATSLTLNETNLIPSTTYYYKVVYTDDVPNTVDSDALTVTTATASLDPNQFAMTPFIGELDLKVGGNVVSAQIDASQILPLYAGQRVKVVPNSGGGLPKVVNNLDVFMPFGYIIYDAKSQSFSVGNRCEIAKTGSCMWLYATTAIDRGAQVCIDEFIQYGVQALNNTSLPIVGTAYDEAIAPGQLIRVVLDTPSYLYDDNSNFNMIAPTQQIFTTPGVGAYVCPTSPRLPLYLRLRIVAPGGGGAGSSAGTNGGHGGDGDDTNFDGTNFILHGGGGGKFVEAGIGGDYIIAGGAPGFGKAFKGQNGAVNNGVIFDTAFAVGPYRLQQFLQGGSGGNSSLFAGAGQSWHEIDAVEDTGSGGAGASILADSTAGIGNIFNSGMGGAGGASLDWTLPPANYSFEIGVKGAAGIAGTNGTAGGEGSNSIIIIDEFYQ